MFQDCELEVHQVVRMHPILGRLSHKGALVSARTGVALHRVASRAHKVVQPRQLDNEPVPVVLIERPLLEVILHERRF